MRRSYPRRRGGFCVACSFTTRAIHASWLNMAEIEIGIFQRSCLRQRLGNEQQLIQQVAALQAERNAKHWTISWQFTAGDARVKLQRLNPKN